MLCIRRDKRGSEARVIGTSQDAVDLYVMHACQSGPHPLWYQQPMKYRFAKLKDRLHNWSLEQIVGLL
jgi:hypothetical protein